MRLNTTFLCGISQVRFPATSHRGERFADDYYLTTDKTRIAELIWGFGDALGSVETAFLTRTADAVAYRSGEVEVEGESLTACLEKRLVEDMLAMKRLELGLWLVKDNAGHFDRGWIVTGSSRGTLVHNNTWATRMTSAAGSFDSVYFSPEELRVARTLRTELPLYIGVSGSPTMLSKGSLRFHRFQYFFGAARSSPDVAMKIAQYCSGLEALVSTSQQELSHQVSERVSALLSPPGAERISHFKLVKQAYGYRSKTVHGATFSPSDVKQLSDCSNKIDQVCRRLFDLYVRDDGRIRDAIEGSAEGSTQFFVDLLLGLPAKTEEEVIGDISQ